MGTWLSPSSSRAARMAATRPSIMSLGATMSAPAPAWLSACRASSSSVSSFWTTPSRTTPQCPCDVYSHRHTSVITMRSGTASFSARTPRCTTPSSAKLPEPSSSLASGMPKRMTAGMPSSATSRPSLTSSSTDVWATPGMDWTGLRTPSPGTTNSGRIRSSTVTRVSRTMRRSVSVRRSRRGRYSGNVDRVSSFSCSSYPNALVAFTARAGAMSNSNSSSSSTQPDSGPSSTSATPASSRALALRSRTRASSDGEE